MNVPRLPTRALILTFALAAPPSFAQAPIVRVPPPSAATPAARPRPRKPRTPAGQPPAFNPALILLDPAHGGDDSGGQIAPGLPEKQVNLDFARRLRTLLIAKGFTVTLTRESDPVPQPAPAPNPDPDPDNPAPKPAPPPPPPPPPTQVTPDQRAELANRIRPVACLILHASATGRGVHLYTSALAPPFSGETPRDIPLWDTAQSLSLANSARLVTLLTEAIQGLGIPLVTGQASIRPIDSLTCPAVLIELAPIARSENPTPVTDDGYQQRIADAVANALAIWRNQAQNILDEQAAFAARAAERAAASGSIKTTDKPAARPRPKPAPGSLVPNAPPPLPRIPQIPKIVAPRTSVPRQTPEASLDPPLPAHRLLDPRRRHPAHGPLPHPRLHAQP